jgi:hypothetical protein
MQRQLDRTVVMVVSVRFSACVAIETHCEPSLPVWHNAQAYQPVHDLLALFDVHDVVALVNYCQW